MRQYLCVKLFYQGCLHSPYVLGTYCVLVKRRFTADGQDPHLISLPAQPLAFSRDVVARVLCSDGNVYTIDYERRFVVSVTSIDAISVEFYSR